MLQIYQGNNGMSFIADNFPNLIKMGKYESALLNAYSGIRNNLHNWSSEVINYLFAVADPDKMRAAGDELPDSDSFTLYRGVAGNGPARRVKGVSWTDSINVASFFAMRFALKDPAVLEITVPNVAILARVADRNESEYLLRLPFPFEPKKRIPVDQMKEAYHSYIKSKQGTMSDEIASV